MLGLEKREWLLVGIIVAIDRITKLIAHHVMPDNELFTYARNTGAGFGVFHGHNALLAALAVVALVALYFALRTQEYAKGHERIALLVLGAGIMGNLWDRLQYRFVVDFIAILSRTSFPIFNVADMAISLSVAYLVAMGLRSTYAGWAFRGKATTTEQSHTTARKPSVKKTKKR